MNSNVEEEAYRWWMGEGVKRKRVLGSLQGTPKFPAGVPLESIT